MLGLRGELALSLTGHDEKSARSLGRGSSKLLYYRLETPLKTRSKARIAKGGSIKPSFDLLAYLVGREPVGERFLRLTYEVVRIEYHRVEMLLNEGSRNCAVIGEPEAREVEVVELLYGIYSVVKA